jgi:hypothetical protein
MKSIMLAVLVVFATFSAKADNGYCVKAETPESIKVVGDIFVQFGVNHVSQGYKYHSWEINSDLSNYAFSKEGSETVVLVSLAKHNLLILCTTTKNKAALQKAVNAHPHKSVKLYKR